MMEVRPIDANALRNKLNDIGGCDAQDDWSKGWDKAIDKAIRLVEKAPIVEAEPVFEWVSAKDRMPQDGTRVVAIVENGMTGILDYEEGKPFAASILFGCVSYVVWWYPIPKSPMIDGGVEDEAN